MRFSQRLGLTPVRTLLQLDGMDERLKNRLWDACSIAVWDPDRHTLYNRGETYNCSVRAYVRDLWHEFFANLLDDKPDDATEFYFWLKTYFFKAEWYEVYDLVEYTLQYEFQQELADAEGLRASLMNILRQEQSGYRIVEDRFVRIIEEAQVEAIEAALRPDVPYAPAQAHIRKALQFLADRHRPDFRNSIKESISAVEAACREFTGLRKATLGEALKKIDGVSPLHPAYKAAFGSLYGFASDKGGIRHSLVDADDLRHEDAQFMLVACSAFISYLTEKASLRVEVDVPF